MNKTDFFVVGNPKSGTTTIHNLLKQHPEIFMPKKKELVYFCTDIHKSSDKFHGYQRNYHVRDLKRYESFYKDARKNQIRGEVTPHYTSSRVAAQNIYEYNKNAKIIIFLREPVAYLYSLHQDLIADLSETEENFKKAIELENTRKKRENIPSTVSYPEVLFYSEMASYKEQIERYVSIFGKKNIKIFFLENMKDNLLGIYKEICKFIGVEDTTFRPELKVFRNSSKKLRFKKLFMFISNSRVLNYIKKNLPSEIYSKVSEIPNTIITRYFFSREHKNKINEEFRNKLRGEYKGKVKELNEYLHSEGLIDFDLLKFWRYEE